MTPLNFKKRPAFGTKYAAKIHYEITVGDDILPKNGWRKKLPTHRRQGVLNEYLQDYFTRKTT